MYLQNKNIKSIVLIFITSLILAYSAYANQGDVHGRDLNVKNLGWIGHIGIEDAGGKVIEMLGETTEKSDWGYDSNLFKNSKSSFKEASPYWGAKYWSLLNSNNHYWRVKDYMIPNAEFIRQVGADYTLTTSWNHPYSYKDFRGNYRIALGKYRCDTFVKSIYATGGVSFGNIVQLPKKIYDMLPDKR